MELFQLRGSLDFLFHVLHFPDPGPANKREQKYMKKPAVGKRPFNWLESIWPKGA
jgi:hypothetical protein